MYTRHIVKSFLTGTVKFLHYFFFNKKRMGNLSLSLPPTQRIKKYIFFKALGGSGSTNKSTQTWTENLKFEASYFAN